MKTPAEHFPTAEQLEQLAQGDETCLEPLALGLTKYAVDTVKWFVRNNPYAFPFQEDLEAEALLALWECLRHQLGKQFQVPSLLATIKIRLNGACHNWLQERNTISPPAGSDKPQLKRHKIKAHHQQISADALFGEFEFDDFVEARLTDEQKTVLHLLLGDHSQSEIADLTGLTDQQTKNIIHYIRDLFRKEDAWEGY